MSLAGAGDRAPRADATDDKDGGGGRERARDGTSRDRKGGGEAAIRRNAVVLTWVVGNVRWRVDPAARRRDTR